MNQKTEPVSAVLPACGDTFLEIPESNESQETSADLPLPLGKSRDGKSIVIDLAKAPHILIAGADVHEVVDEINTILLSLLLGGIPGKLNLVVSRFNPNTDFVYRKLPHLRKTVFSTPEQMLNTLQWAVDEIKKRYTILRENKEKHIHNFNLSDKGRFPYIVIVIDELAGLLQSGVRDEAEMALFSIAMNGRAAGVHLVVASSRLDRNNISVSVACFPTRLCFRTDNEDESRLVLNREGAEKLSGENEAFLAWSLHSELQIIHTPKSISLLIEKVADAQRTTKQILRRKK